MRRVDENGMSSLLGRSRPPLRPGASREFVDEILAELAASHWSPRGWARFLERSFVSSWRGVQAHPGAAAEVTAAHLLLAARRPSLWALSSWGMVVTHLGMLGDRRAGLGWPNRLTLLRANLPAMVRPPAPTIGLLAFACDWTDGHLARKDRDTAFGGYADLFADAVFWCWYVQHHEPNRVLRLSGQGLWLGPSVIITAAFFLRGRAVNVTRPLTYRTVAVGLQILVTWRATKPDRRELVRAAVAAAWPPSKADWRALVRCVVDGFLSTESRRRAAART